MNADFLDTITIEDPDPTMGEPESIQLYHLDGTPCDGENN